MAVNFAKLRELLRRGTLNGPFSHARQASLSAVTGPRCPTRARAIAPRRTLGLLPASLSGQVAHQGRGAPRMAVNFAKLRELLRRGTLNGPF